MGFDCKVSEDFLPEDLPSHEDYNLKPYDPDAEEEGETDDEARDKPEGETSDDYTSSDSSDNEDREEDAMSSGNVARSTVSVHINKSTAGSQVFSETNDPQPRSESVGSSQKGWWKPLFGKKKEPRKPADQSNKDMQSDNKNWVPPIAPSEPNTSTETNEETKVEEFESSSSESESAPVRCFTPHGGSASEDGDSDSSESESD